MDVASARSYLERYAERAGVRVDPTGVADRTVTFPATFSLVDNPDATLSAIHEMVGCALGGAVMLELDQRPCAQTDLCAESLYSALAMYVEAAGVRLVSRNPESEQAWRRAELSGLGVVAGDDEFGTATRPGCELIPLEQSWNRNITAESEADHEVVASRITAKLERLFTNAGVAPSEQVSWALSSFIGEAISNATEHGGGDWWVAAYIRKEPHENAGCCQVTIFNLGPTIAETLQAGLSPDSRNRIYIENLAAHHAAEGYWSDQWSLEALWTLCGYQHGISRFSCPAWRGQGSKEMLRVIDMMNNPTRDGQHTWMCLLSGRTHVVFDGSYPLQKSPDPDRQGRWQTALNQSNDLFIPPDPRYVTTLGRYFPGTLISLGFQLDAHHLQPIRGPEHGND